LFAPWDRDGVLNAASSPSSRGAIVQFTCPGCAGDAIRQPSAPPGFLAAAPPPCPNGGRELFYKRKEGNASAVEHSVVVVLDLAPRRPGGVADPPACAARSGARGVTGLLRRLPRRLSGRTAGCTNGPAAARATDQRERKRTRRNDASGSLHLDPPLFPPSEPGAGHVPDPRSAERPPQGLTGGTSCTRLQKSGFLDEQLTDTCRSAVSRASGRLEELGSRLAPRLPGGEGEWHAPS